MKKLSAQQAIDLLYSGQLDNGSSARLHRFEQAQMQRARELSAAVPPAPMPIPQRLPNAPRPIPTLRRAMENAPGAPTVPSLLSGAAWPDPAILQHQAERITQGLPEPMVGIPPAPTTYLRTPDPTQTRVEPSQEEQPFSLSSYLGYGAKSLGQTFAATPPMLVDLSRQAGEDWHKKKQSTAYQDALMEQVIAENHLSMYQSSDRGLDSLGRWAPGTEYDQLQAQVEQAKQRVAAVAQAEGLDTPLTPEHSMGMRKMQEAAQSQERALSGLGSTGRFVGGTLLSVGQSAAMLPLGLIHPALPLVGMGAIASADRGYALSQEGSGAGEALGRGLVSGGIEAVTEKIPLDSMLTILKKGGGTSAVRTLLRQMGIEGGEESASYLLNLLSDKAAQDPNAVFSFRELAQSALGGAISGGILSGGGEALYGLNRRLRANTEVQPIPNAEPPQPIPNASGGEVPPSPDPVVTNPIGERVDRRTRRALDAAGKKLGVSIVFDENLGEDNGLYDSKNKTLRISMASKSPLRVVATHEITHRLNETSPQSYAVLKNLAYEAMQREDSQENTRRFFADVYQESDDIVEDEIVAHFTQMAATDLNEFERLVGIHRNVAQKLLDLLDEFLNKTALAWNGQQDPDALTGLFGELDGDSLAAVRRAWGEALQRADPSAAGTGNAQHLVRADAFGNPYVQIDEDILDGVPQREWISTVKRELSARFPNGIDMGGWTVGVTGQGKNEFTRSRYSQQLGQNRPTVYADKFKAAANLDEIVSTAQNVRNEDLLHPRKDKIQSFNRGDIRFRIGNKKYLAKVITGVLPDNSEIFYDLVDIRPVTAKEELPSSMAAQSAIHYDRSSSFDPTLPQSTSGVNAILPETNENSSQKSRQIPPELLEKYGAVKGVGGVDSGNARAYTQGTEGGVSNETRRESEIELGGRAIYRTADRGSPQGNAEAGNRGRGAQETSDRFYERVSAAASGTYETKRIGRLTYAYHPIADIAAKENAVQIKQEMKTLGMTAFLYDGAAEVNDGKVTQQSAGGAATLIDGTVLISNSCTLAAKNVAGHEYFHSRMSNRDAAAQQFYDKMVDSIDFGSKTFNEFYDQFVEFHTDASYDFLANPDRLYQELAAYISGDLYEQGKSALSEAFTDFAPVQSAWRAMMAANASNGSPSGGAAFSSPKSGFGPNTVGSAQAAARKTNEELVTEYGALHRGEAPRAREASIAAETPGGKTSRFVQNAAESAAVDDRTVEALREEVAAGTFAYQPISDKFAVAQANDRLDTFGVERSQQHFRDKIAAGERLTKPDIALGERLIQEAVRRGDLESAVSLIADVAMVGTEMGQSVQALRLLKRFSPEGQLLALKRVVERINAQDAKKNRKKVTLPAASAEDILHQTTPEGLRDAVNRAYGAIAEQAPATFLDKWNAWRYLAMLGNPRTHVRNLVGNLAFMIPRTLKNAIKAGVETLPVWRGEKSAAFVNPMSKADRVYRQFAKADATEMMESLLSGGKMNPANLIRDNRIVFKTKALEQARRGNSDLMEKEDALFLRAAYTDSLAQYLKANRIDPSVLRESDPLGALTLERARQYAVKEAKKATFRDANRVADALARFSQTNGATALFTEGMMPFKKTPLNILRRGVEYSPAGLLKTAFDGMSNLKNGKISADELLDELCAGLAGTAIAAVGMWFASQGWAVGSGDDDDKQRAFDKLHGRQTYALEIGGKSYTIDWASPAALPFFVGVEAWKIGKNGDEFTLSDALDGLSAIAEPMFQMTLLDGINSALTASAYDENPLTAFVGSTVTGYLSQGVPTILGQAARTLDGTRRNSYYLDKNAEMPKLAQDFLNRNAAKIPFVSRTLAPYTDAWGREKAGGSIGARALQSFLSPGYSSVIEVTPADIELQRLYDQTGESVLPTMPQKYIKQGNETQFLTAHEYALLTKTKGATALEIIGSMIASPVYQAFSDEQKVKAARDAQVLALTVAKDRIGRHYDVPAAQQKALDAKQQAGIHYADYLLLSVALDDVHSDKDASGKTISLSASRNKKLLIDGIGKNLSPKQTRYLYDAFEVSKQVR